MLGNTLISDIMTQIQVYTPVDGQCIITALGKANELERQWTLKQGL